MTPTAGTVRAIVGAFVLGLLVAAPDRGEAATLQLVTAPSNVVETTIAIADPGLNTPVRLRNAGDAAAGSLRLRPSAFLLRQSDGKSVAATWTRDGTATGIVTLDPGAEATVWLSATIPEAGVYETGIDTEGPVSDAGRIRVVVTRAIQPLPGDVMEELKPAAQVWGGWRSVSALVGTPQEPEILIGLRNTTSKPVEFRPAAVTGFNRRLNDAENAVVTDVMPWVEAGPCVSPLPAAAACAMRLHFSAALTPGTYAIDVGVSGTDGGWSQRTATIRVRAAAPIAFLVIALGAGTGWYINLWRSSGRRAVSGLITLARLKDKLQRLTADPDDADSARLLGSARDQLEEIDAQIREGTDTTAALARFASHLAHLAATVTIGAGLAKLSPTGRDALRSRWSDLVARIDGDRTAEAANADLDKALTSLAGEVTAWPTLANLASAARFLGSTVEALAQAGCPEPPSQDVAPAALRKAAADSLTPLAVADPGDTVPARATHLAQKLDAARVAAAALAGRGAAILAERAGGLAKPDAKLPADQVPRATALAAEATAFAAAATGADSAERRLAALGALWDRYRDLAAKRKLLEDFVEAKTLDAGPSPTAAPVALPALDAPVSLILPASGTSQASLEQTRTRNEIVTNLLILVATSLAGVVTLWAPDLTWGSVTNVIAAFLAGMAAQVTVGQAVARR